MRNLYPTLPAITETYPTTSYHSSTDQSDLVIDISSGESEVENISGLNSLSLDEHSPPEDGNTCTLVEAAEKRGQHGKILAPPNETLYNANVYYVVYKGLQPGVYSDWGSSSHQTLKVSGAVHHKITGSYEQACRQYSKAVNNGWGGIVLSLDDSADTRPVPPHITDRLYPPTTNETRVSSAGLVGRKTNTANSPISRKKTENKRASVNSYIGSSAPKNVSKPLKAETSTNSQAFQAVRQADTRPSKVTPTSVRHLRPRIFPINYHLLSDNHRSSYRQIPTFSDSALYTPNQNKIYVVLKGQYPGVYYGRDAVRAAIGSAGCEGKLEVASNLSEAYQMFTESLMKGDVMFYEPV